MARVSVLVDSATYGLRYLRPVFPTSCAANNVLQAALVEANKFFTNLETRQILSSVLSTKFL